VDSRLLRKAAKRSCDGGRTVSATAAPAPRRWADRSASAQFFVVTASNANLPPDYAIIGTITEGLDVVDRIGKLGTASQQPTMVVEIEQATVVTSSG